MELSLEITRDKLIGVLKEKVQSLKDEGVALVKETEARRDARKTTRDEIADWYVEIARLMANGEVKIDSKGNPVAIDDEETEVPAKPSRTKLAESTRQLNDLIETIKSNTERAVIAVESSLKLVELSDNPTIQIQTADYNKLLMLSIRDQYRHGYYY